MSDIALLNVQARQVSTRTSHTIYNWILKEVNRTEQVNVWIWNTTDKTTNGIRVSWGECCVARACAFCILIWLDDNTTSVTTMINEISFSIFFYKIQILKINVISELLK